VYTKGIQKVEGTLKRKGTTTNVHFKKERQEKRGRMVKRKFPIIRNNADTQAKGFACV
jgi:hypothetical protein